MGDGVVKFEDWEKVLRDAVPVKLQAGYREAVVKFRYWLREKGKTASVEVFNEHLAWRTEKTYRHWAWRLARLCAPKPAEELTHEEVRRWLSEMLCFAGVSILSLRHVDFE
jgi:hypothetical protein